jgi:hypothetical protein
MFSRKVVVMGEKRPTRRGENTVHLPMLQWSLSVPTKPIEENNYERVLVF